MIFVVAAAETAIGGRRGPYNTLCAEVGTAGRRLRKAFAVLINRGVATDILGLNAYFLVANFFDLLWSTLTGLLVNVLRTTGDGADSSDDTEAKELRGE